MNCKLVAIKIENRQVTAVRVQNILTDNGCLIKVRLGLHDIRSKTCTTSGLILLEVQADNSQLDKMLAALNDIEGVTAKGLII